MPTISDDRSRVAWRVALRVVLALIGGYIAAEAVSALLSVALRLSDMVRSEAVLLASIVNIFLYPIAILWCYAERRLLRVAAVIMGAIALCSIAIFLTGHTPPIWPSRG